MPLSFHSTPAGESPSPASVCSIAWWEHPSRIIWVDLPKRRLQGFDNYWVDWPRYGMFQDPENMGTMYEGDEAVAFEDHGDHEIAIDPTPPDGVEIMRGYMLTDEQARFVGLI